MPLKFSIPEKKTQDKIASSENIVKTGTTNSHHFANSTTTSFPITKNAQFAGSAANVSMAQPMFFSPLHTPQNWQIASKRREVYMWSFISPCNITLNDGSVKDISAIYEEVGKDEGEIVDLFEFEGILDGEGSVKSPDKVSKKYVIKKANKISISGCFEDLNVTFDHKCRVIKREDIACHKSRWNSKICVAECGSKTCNTFKCHEYKDIEYKISTVNAEEIETGDFVLIPFNTEVKESTITSADGARYIGHLASDGSISEERHNVRICMGNREQENVYPVIKRFHNSYGLDANLVNVSTIQEVRTSQKSIFNYCHKAVVGKGKDKKFTSEVMFLNTELQKHVLGAYIESDGYFNKINESIEITTYSKHLANQLLNMMYRCGILACGNKQPISKSRGTFKTDNTHRYIINVKTSECYKLAEYCPGRLKDFIQHEKRSINKRFFWKNYVVSRVSSNESFDYSGPVYDIRVSPTYTVTVNGVSVHQSRFYYENEPKIAAGVDFYSTFSMNGFTLECPSKKVLKYFEKLVKDLKLNHWLKLISHEYFMIGDVFPFTEIDCSICQGSGAKSNGEPCNHPGGTIKRMVVLNPDWIEVQSNVLASEPSITLVPDEELRQIVSKRDPIQIYRRLPKKLIDMVSNGRPIPLSNRCVSHIKHNASPYGIYGTSLLRRLFTVLAYKTKLMTANWIVAERLILPVRVVKIGDKDRPATAADIMDVSNQITAVANDPNLTLVTHHAFCHDEETEALTDNGWKKYNEVLETDKVMIFDPVTGIAKYEKPLALNQFDYDGPMYHFSGNKIDMKVTPNHRMLGYKRNKKDFYTEDAEAFTNRNECDRYVRSVAKYDGEQQKYIEIGEHKISTDVFMKLAGYYLAEGYAQYDEKKRQYRVSISQSPTVNPDYCSQLDDIFEALPFKFSKYEYEYKTSSWNILSKSIADQFIKWFGDDSYTKKIPAFIKNLSPKNLRLLIETYCNGDASKYVMKNGSVYTQCGTMSKQLADDLLEIMFKAGYSPTVSRYGKTCHNKSGETEQYVVNCNLSQNAKGRFARIKNTHIQKVDYKGKVWCFTTSTGYFVTKRDGRISIQGNSYEYYGATGKIHNITAELEQVGKEILDGLMLNQALLNGEQGSYSSAQVGVETMIRRLESWRTTLSEWVENHIFLPVAMMQGFIKEKDPDDDINEDGYLYPKMKWEDLNLRDKSGHLQLMMQLHDKQLISSQKLLQEFDIDYDQEVERLREEQVTTGPAGQMGGPGGAPGGMPDMGGMGGMGGMPDMGGGAPPMGGPEMGGMPGSETPGMEGAPGMAPGGAGMAPGGVGAGPVAGSPLPPNFKIGKKGKGGKKLDDQMKPAPPRFVKLTSLEQKLHKIIQSISIPQQLFIQYQVQPPGEKQPFFMDFAYPALGLGIESDGKRWHEDIESKMRDKQRDQKLANIGWRIIRFKEDAIQQQPDAVKNVINQQIVAAEQDKKRKFKKASVGEEIENTPLTFEKFANCLISKEDSLAYDRINLENDLGYIYLIGN